jgi:hypothetical protein
MDIKEKLSENFQNRITALINLACTELQDKIGGFNLDAKIHLKIVNYDFNFDVVYPDVTKEQI